MIYTKTLLVGAFLEERLDYSHGFLSVFFDTPGVRKIVLPKVLQNLKEGAKLYLLSQGTEPKMFSFFPRNVQYRARLKVPHSIF